MKKIFFLMIAMVFAVSACGTSAKPSVPAAVIPSPISEANLQATAAILSLQTLQAQPTATLMPSVTPIIETAAPTSTPTVEATATETQNPVLLTLTATLGTGTPFANESGTPNPTSATFSVFQPSATLDLRAPTETAHPQTYGTMPPNLPAGKIIIINKAKTDAYISLHCTTKEGYTTIVEYPVSGKINAKAPAGRYSFVVWVGGKMFTGSFNLSVGGSAVVTISKDGVQAK